MSHKRVKLVNRIARILLKENRELATRASGQEVTEKLWKICLHKTRNMKPQTLGLIAAQDTEERNLYSVHCSAWLKKYDTGRNLLRAIVATAIIAEMDKIHDEKANA
jgi:hypothetical protein